MPFTYTPRVTGSNFEPIAVEVRRDGVLLEPLGVEVLCNVRDQDTKIAIVTDGETVESGQLGVWNYVFTPQQVALITGYSNWLVTWTVRVGDYTFKTPSAGLLPVRKSP